MQWGIEEFNKDIVIKVSLCKDGERASCCVRALSDYQLGYDNVNCWRWGRGRRWVRELGLLVIHISRVDCPWKALVHLQSARTGVKRSLKLRYYRMFAQKYGTRQDLLLSIRKCCLSSISDSVGLSIAHQLPSLALLMQLPQVHTARQRTSFTSILAGQPTISDIFGTHGLRYWRQERLKLIWKGTLDLSCYIPPAMSRDSVTYLLKKG